MRTCIVKVVDVQSANAVHCGKLLVRNGPPVQRRERELGARRCGQVNVAISVARGAVGTDIGVVAGAARSGGGVAEDAEAGSRSHGS